MKVKQHRISHIEMNRRVKQSAFHSEHNARGDTYFVTSPGPFGKCVQVDERQWALRISEESDVASKVFAVPSISSIMEAISC